MIQYFIDNPIKGSDLLKIALITTKQLHDYTKEIIDNLNLNCEIQYFVYSNFSNLVEIYAKNYDLVDGFLISSLLSSQWIKKTYPICRKPVVSFNTDMLNLYKTLFNLVIQDRNTDFSKVYLDFMNSPLFPDKLQKLYDYDKPVYELSDIAENIEELDLGGIFNFCRSIVENITLRWEQGSLDLAIITFSNIAEELEKKGIKYHLACPSKDHVESSVHRIIKDIQLHKLSENQPAVIDISIDKFNPNDEIFNKDNELLPILLHESITNYNKNHLTNFVIKRNHGSFEIFTSQKTVDRITNNKTICSLTNHLKSTLKFTVSIGYGYGEDVSEAKYLASLANKEAKYKPYTCSYLATSMDQLVGPLTSENNLIVQNNKMEYYEKVAKKVGLSPINVQKIIATMKILKTDNLTAQDLANQLSITVRSANRFLNKLMETGIAEVIGEEFGTSRGRPKNVYKINFDS